MSDNRNVTSHLELRPSDASDHPSVARVASKGTLCLFALFRQAVFGPAVDDGEAGLSASLPCASVSRFL